VGHVKRPLIFVSAPYRVNVKENVRQAERCCCFVYQQRGIPFAPNLLYTRFLADFDLEEQLAGLNLGAEVLQRCDEVWAFGKPTAGMMYEIDTAISLGIPVRRFTLDCQEVKEDG
jgi:hypothetical protein